MGICQWSQTETIVPTLISKTVKSNISDKSALISELDQVFGNDFKI